jgi:serine/threonine protein kinase
MILNVDPNHRLSIPQILSHPFLNQPLPMSQLKTESGSITQSKSLPKIKRKANYTDMGKSPSIPDVGGSGLQRVRSKSAL